MPKVYYNFMCWNKVWYHLTTNNDNPHTSVYCTIPRGWSIVCSAYIIFRSVVNDKGDIVNWLKIVLLHEGKLYGFGCIGFGR